MLKPFIGMLVLCLLAGNLQAQSNQNHPTVGLALSGGGIKGVAHIGVLKVLEEVDMPIDYLAGTSMGSIMGALYSTGYRAEDLEQMVLNFDWTANFSDAPTRRYLSMNEKFRDGRFIGSLPIRDGLKVGLPTGVVAGQRISELLTRLTWPVHHIDDFTKLPIPFVCVATDLATGEPVVLDHGYLPDALRASMAVPTIFTPMYLDGKLLADGAMARNLPAVDVRDLGADIVIGVDISSPLKAEEELTSFTEIIGQAVGFHLQYSKVEQRAETDYLILPDIENFNFFGFSRVEELIARGEEAARAMLPQLKALADSVNALRKPHSKTARQPQPMDSIYIQNLSIEGTRNIPRSFVRSLIDLNLPTWVTADDLKDETDRIFSTAFFERVTYRLAPLDSGTHLSIHVLEKEDDQLRFGFRFDQRTSSSVLVNTTFRNIVSRASQLILELKLGERAALNAEYIQGLGRRDRLAFRMAGQFRSRTFDLFQDEERRAEFRFQTYAFEAGLGTYFSTNGLYALSLREEYSVNIPRIAPPTFGTERFNFLMLTATTWVDTIDRAVFPTTGHFFFMKHLGTSSSLGSDRSMTQHQLTWRISTPLTSSFTLQTGLEVGVTLGDAPPAHYQFTLGGQYHSLYETGRFVGLLPDEVPGRYLKKFSAGLQFEVRPNQFVILEANTGNGTESWNWDIWNEPMEWGAGLTLGTLTQLGPISLTLAHSSLHRELIDFSVGFRF